MANFVTLSISASPYESFSPEECKVQTQKLVREICQQALCTSSARFPAAAAQACTPPHPRLTR